MGGPPSHGRRGVNPMSGKGTTMSDSEPLEGTTSGAEGNAQNHDKVEGPMATDKPSQAEGDDVDTDS
jgi:hypothetical protein